MKNLKIMVGLFCTLILSGCASQQVVNMPDNFWDDASNKKIAIAFVKQPEMYAHRSGGQGLLDLAINEMVTSSVEDHINTISHEKFENGKSRIAEVIKAKGGEAVILPVYYDASEATELPKEQRKKGYFSYDASVVKENYNATHLMVIQTIAAGTMRDYYGIIPTSKPRGYINADVTLVDLADNRITMKNKIIEEVNLPEGVDWDDAENNYPEITKVVHAALEKAALQLTENL